MCFDTGTCRDGDLDDLVPTPLVMVLLMTEALTIKT
jgi:hypothetical protein